MKSILVVDNQISSCELLDRFLTKNQYRVQTTTRSQHALEILKKDKFDFIIAEFNLPDIAGAEFYEQVVRMSPQSSVIFIGREVNLKNAVNLILQGAHNFLSKPLIPEELLNVLNESDPRDPKVKKETLVQRAELSVNRTSDLKLVFGKCGRAQDMINQVERVGPTNYSVVIEGETGTGKESLARLIHKNSPRRNGPFVAVDCGCLSKEIASSELFGHEKGAFTGAVCQKTGFFELADGGTIFLDEIANLSSDTQMALLRALQEKVIRKIGGAREIPIDVRIITATNEDLLEKSGTSGFRSDLYFRLSEYVLQVPSLRERLDDLPLFIDFFLEETSKELGILKPKLSKEVKECFFDYPWPGNIRELKNVIRGACLFPKEDNYIYKDAIPERIAAPYDCKSEADFIPEREEKLDDRFGRKDLKSTALKAEAIRIIEVLNKVHFNKTKAAELLNIHRKTLYSKLKLMNIPY